MLWFRLLGEILAGGDFPGSGWVGHDSEMAERERKERQDVQCERDDDPDRTRQLNQAIYGAGSMRPRDVVEITAAMALLNSEPLQEEREYRSPKRKTPKKTKNRDKVKAARKQRRKT